MVSLTNNYFIIITTILYINVVTATWRVCDNKTSEICAKIGSRMGGTCWWKFKTMCDTGPFGGQKDLKFLQNCQDIGGVRTYSCEDSRSILVSDAIQEILKNKIKLNFFFYNKY